MLRPGEYAYDKLNNERVQILAVSEVRSFVSYKVLRLSDERIYKLAADALTTDSPDAGSGRNENYIRYVSPAWDERHTLQRKLYETVTRYVSKSYNKAMRSRGKNMWFIFLLIMMQRLVSSSTSDIFPEFRSVIIVKMEGGNAS
jgi:hypothetical protein